MKPGYLLVNNLKSSLSKEASFKFSESFDKILPCGDAHELEVSLSINFAVLLFSLEMRKLSFQIAIHKYRKWKDLLIINFV